MTADSNLPLGSLLPCGHTLYHAGNDVKGILAVLISLISFPLFVPIQHLIIMAIRKFRCEECGQEVEVCLNCDWVKCSNGDRMTEVKKSKKKK